MVCQRSARQRQAVADYCGCWRRLPVIWGLTLANKGCVGRREGARCWRGFGSGIYEVFMTPSGLSETHFVILCVSSDALGVRGSGESGVRPKAQLRSCAMALVVFETICILACGFFLYVLLQWRREDKGKTAFRLAGDQKRAWRIRNARLNVVSFRRDSHRGSNRRSAQELWHGGARAADAEGNPSCNECERMAHEQIARAGVAWRRD